MAVPGYLKKRITAYADTIGAARADFITYDDSIDMGCPNLEYHEGLYHYVVVERGEELSRFTTADEDELLYLVFKNIAQGLASDHELKNRIPNQDSRRLIFVRAQELIGRLHPLWAQRLSKEYETILSQYPFNDDKP